MNTNPCPAPIWPPPDGAYDYILELNDSEVAWEFLRRNPDYQRDVSQCQEALSHPQDMVSGQKVWFDDQHTMTARRWGLLRFVDPALRAPEAPIDWMEELGAAKIDALAREPRQGEPSDAHLAELLCVRHIVVSSGGEETLLINTSDKALTLTLRDATALRGPVRSRRQRLLREAVIALDGRIAGATHQDVAGVIAGAERARAAWKNSDPSLKDRMRRALKAGMLLRNGRYRILIQQK